MFSPALAIIYPARRCASSKDISSEAVPRQEIWEPNNWVFLSPWIKAEFTQRMSASSVERLANQRLHLVRDEVSDWLDAQLSTLTALK
ncbi:hypothetical protein TNCV_4224771 [Trichonephila clavipes]|uniref:Uncharacterized protein n=1 Tax=Trichonephila clavipes TaxID=2585209 RepID=A0A8X6T5J5_TRICX|nr:hypothetical protein TNCV_4224771 [Trichonephila clavipes]